MRKVLFVLAFSVALSCPGFGRQTGEPSQASAEKPAVKSPELAEAARLSEKAAELQDLKRYDEALTHAKRALELREKALGSEHELIASSLNKIAGVYSAKTLYADAEALYRRSLKILEKRFGAESKYLTDTLERLAIVRFAQRNNDDAQTLFLRALAIKERAFGPDQIETAQTLNLFGKFYERTNRPVKAAELYKRSLAIREKALGPDHASLAETLENCACVLILNDHVDEGTQYMDRANMLRNLSGINPVRQPDAVLQGLAILKVRAEYPTVAWHMRVRGSVVVEITVDECGRVMDARALSGPDELRGASVKAARGWRFTPTRVAGRPVKVTGSIIFSFNL